MKPNNKAIEIIIDTREQLSYFIDGISTKKGTRGGSAARYLIRDQVIKKPKNVI